MQRTRIHRFSLLFLVTAIIRTVQAAFTTPVCDFGNNLCVQQDSYGVWCFYSTLTTDVSTCDPPYSIPLAAHLTQDLSIAYYSPSGQFLGGTAYPVPGSGITYLCMSSLVAQGQYYTSCSEAPGDNEWRNDCSVDVAPSPVSDGCYGGVVRHFVVCLRPQIADFILCNTGSCTRVFHTLSYSHHRPRPKFRWWHRS
jgi:hypothetical protein